MNNLYEYLPRIPCFCKGNFWVQICTQKIFHKGTQLVCFHLRHIHIKSRYKNKIDSSINLKFSEEVDADDDYPGALKIINAKVSLRGQEIGQIGGVRVDRQRIGENSFHVTFDGHRYVLRKLETQRRFQLK